MIKNIIFDWSGVISDSFERHLLVCNEIFKEFGVREITLEELRENWRQPYMLFYNKYLPNITIEEENKSYERNIVKHPNVKPVSGMVDLLKKLKDKDIKMVVLSSDSNKTLLPEIVNFGLSDYFLDVVSNSHDKSKEIKELMEKNNFKLEETIFIGDSNHEIEVGKEIGIKTCAVTWGFCTKEILQSLNPDFLIEKVEDLEKILE